MIIIKKQSLFEILNKKFPEIEEIEKKLTN